MTSFVSMSLGVLSGHAGLRLGQELHLHQAHCMIIFLTPVTKCLTYELKGRKVSLGSWFEGMVHSDGKVMVADGAMDVLVCCRVPQPPSCQNRKQKQIDHK